MKCISEEGRLLVTSESSSCRVGVVQEGMQFYCNSQCTANIPATNASTRVGGEEGARLVAPDSEWDAIAVGAAAVGDGVPHSVDLMRHASWGIGLSPRRSILLPLHTRAIIKGQPVCGGCSFRLKSIKY